MSKKTRIFLSYASEDKARVRNLCKRLKKEGFEPWMDETGIDGGQQWRRRIIQEIDQSDFFCLCLTPRCVEKLSPESDSFLKLELRRARNRQEVLKKQIKNARIRKDLVLLLTPSSQVDPSDKLRELSKFNPEVIFLIPVRLKDCTVPKALNHLQYIDYFKSDGWSKLLSTLRQEIRARKQANG